VGTGQQLSISWFSVSSLGPGTWYLQSLGQSNAMGIYIVPYIDETQPSTNASDVISFNMATSRVWYDINITSAVTKSFNALGYVKLRIASQSGSKQTDEFFLIVPPGAGTISGILNSYFQIEAQGASQTQMDSLVDNEWSLIELSNILNSTPTNVNCSIISMNGTIMNITPTTAIEGSSTTGWKIVTKWTPTEARGFVEGTNYEASCGFSIFGSTIAGLEQYVYVSPHRTIMTRLSQFVVSIANIFGLLQSPIKVTQITQTAAATGQTNIVTSVMKGKDSYSGANCTVSLIDSAGNAPYNSSQMSVFGASALGMYSFSFNASQGAGAPWTVKTACFVNDSAGSNVTYVNVGTLSPAISISAAAAGQIYEGTPSVKLLQGAGYAGYDSTILAQVKIGSSSISNAICNVTVYYPTNTSKVVDAAGMSYIGDDGIYSYTWIPPSYVTAFYPARISCTGGALGTFVVQDSTSINIQDGVNMQVIS
jgi:hypothetical protein